MVEIVTEPDFTDTSEVKDYAKKLQQIFRYLGVSNADMEKGDMRLEANVSVRPVGQKELPSYRVELKNINSFRFMVAAIEYEIKRQIEALENGQKLHQETRGWDEDKKETFLQRSKEEANDYRYFPEPDLPEIKIKSDEIRIIREKLPELPDSKRRRFEQELKIKSADARVLTESKELAEFFEKTVEVGKANNVSPQQIANYIINRKPDINSVSPDQIVKDIASKGTGVIGDIKELEKVCKEVVAENQATVGDFTKGKVNAMQALIGAVMKKTAGKADVSKAREILEKLIKV